MTASKQLTATVCIATLQSSWDAITTVWYGMFFTVYGHMINRDKMIIVGAWSQLAAGLLGEISQCSALFSAALLSWHPHFIRLKQEFPREVLCARGVPTFMRHDSLTFADL